VIGEGGMTIKWKLRSGVFKMSSTSCFFLRGANTARLQTCMVFLVGCMGLTVVGIVAE
jgi:hypothetical protein